MNKHAVSLNSIFSGGLFSASPAPIQRRLLRNFLLGISLLQIPNVVIGALIRGVFAPFTLVSLGAIFLTLGIYWLAKRDWYRVAVVGLIVLLMIFPAVTLSGLTQSTNTLFIFWLIVPIVIAALFFGPWETFFVLGLALLETYLLSLYAVTITAEDLPRIASIFTVVGAVVLCFAYLREQDIKQIAYMAVELRRREKNLSSANRSLENVVLDRTQELTKANLALMQRDQYLTEIMDALPDAIIDVNHDFTEIDFHENPNVPLYDIVDGLYRIVSEACGEGDPILPVYNAISIVFSTKRPMQFDFELDGTHYAATCVMAKRDHALVVIRNLSRQQHIENYLSAADQHEAMSVLAGGIGHDLNNLLMAIMAQSSLGSRKIDSAHPAQKHIARVKSSAQSATILSRQLMAYSRNEQLERQQLCLNDLVERNLDLFHTTIGSHADLVVDLAPELAHVHANEAQLQQIVMNLLINSMQALDGFGEIRIKTGFRAATGKTDHLVPIVDGALNAGEYCYLMVQDNGCGMDAETAERIFEPFFTTKLHGTGLGLASILRILQEHGGNIGLKTAPGVGTTFYLYLPAVTRKTGELFPLAG